MFSYVSPEQRIPKGHPLRAIRALVDKVFVDMSREFDRLYATIGRPSIPPERLLRAQLLQIFYSIRSERLLMEQLDYNLLFRWFVGLTMDDRVWDPTTFTKNRDRLLNQAIARSFLQHVVERAQGLMSDEHFTVDGTLIEAWASHKSFQRKDGKPGGDGTNFRGQTRANDTHASTTDPEAKLVRKGDGREAKLAFAGHAAMENRHGLCVLFEVKPAAGSDAEVAVQQIAELQQRGLTPHTVGADRGYCSRNFIEGLRGHGVVPHPAPMKERRMLGVKVCSKAHRLSQKCRRKIEEIFGWAKTTGCFRKSRYLGVERTHAAAQYVVAACNLVRMARLSVGPPNMARASR